MPLRDRVALLLLVAGLGACARSPEREDVSDKRVSIIQLIASPKTFHGRVVSVAGYATIRFEHNVLCPFLDAASGKDCVWLNYDDGPYESEADMKRYAAAEERWHAFDGKRIHVLGTFDASDTGHLGSTSGGIHRITEVNAF